MRLTTLLRLQFIYAALGFAANVVSLGIILLGKPQPSSTHPIVGMIFMIVYALCLIPGCLRKMVLYRVLMCIAIVVFGYLGIIVHIINIFTQPQLYQSIVAWILAVGLNVYGLVLNIIAVSGKFKI